MSNENTGVSMNKELREWLDESRHELEKSKKEGKYSKKKPHGKCEICGEKKAEAICIKCGRNVCKSCYFKLINVCKKCIPVEIAGKWDGSRIDWEKELGVEWVE